MNKKFLSVVLFGALMAGSSVTFTGCIDNDEPAGIEELRTAKAALIKANEAYRLAEVEYQKLQNEFRQVEVEQQKVLLEMDKLNLEIKKASSDYEIALWEAKKDSVVEDFKGKLFKLQETAAENETSYLKALAELEAARVYVTDSVFSDKLVAITGDLKIVSGKIKNTMATITGLSNNLLKFSSDSIAVAKDFIAADIKSGQSKLANDSVTLAEFKKLAADYSSDAVDAQIVDINKQIIAIDKKVAELKQTITTNDATKAPIEQAISKQKVAFEKTDQSVALNVPAAIESEFIKWAMENTGSAAYTALVNDGEYTPDYETKQVNGNDVYSFKTAPVIEKLKLGTVKQDNTIDEKAVLSAKIENLATEVKEHGVELYKEAYEKLERVTVYNLPSLSTGKDITEEDKAKVAVALEKVNADLTTAKTTYEADTTALNAAYAAYKTAATAYGITQQLTSTIEENVGTKWDAYVKAKDAYDKSLPANVLQLRAAIEQAETDLKPKKEAYDKLSAEDKKDYGNTTVQAYLTAQDKVTDAKAAYDKAMEKVDDTKLQAAQKALIDEMTAYYPKRKALVGEEFKATITGFNEDKEFVIADKLASLDAEQFAILINQDKTKVVGLEWSSVSVNQNSTDEDGAVQTWIKASAKLYGTQKTSINAGLRTAKTVILPLDEVYASINSASVTTTMPSASVYVVLQYAKNAFSTIDDWTSYAESLSKTAAEKAALEAPIIAEIAKQKEALDAINEPLRDTIYEICKLDAQQFTQAGPVKTVATALGITTMNSQGEKQVLEALKTTLSNIGGNLNIKYTYYTYEDGILASEDGTIAQTNNISTAVANIETSIKALNEYIADKKDDLASFDNESVTIAKKTKAQYEAELANAQEALKGYQAAFDALNKAKDELIAAITK